MGLFFTFVGTHWYFKTDAGSYSQLKPGSQRDVGELGRDCILDQLQGWMVLRGRPAKREFQ